jgi:hypothetical protein
MTSAELAAITGISAADIEANARWTAELMAADGIAPEMLNDESKKNFAMAYLSEVGRRMAVMQEHYFIRTGAAEALCGMLLTMLKQDQA